MKTKNFVSKFAKKKTASTPSNFSKAGQPGAEQGVQEINEVRRLEELLKDTNARLGAYIKQNQDLEKEKELLKNEIKERVMITEALYENENQFRALVASIPGAVYRFRIDAHWTIEYLSEKIEEITLYSPSHFFLKNVETYRDIIHPEDRAGVEKAVRSEIESTQPFSFFSVEYRIIDAKGDERWLKETGQAVYDSDGMPLWLDGTIFDESKRKFAEEELRRLASIDGLTQIATRRIFDEYLVKEWRRMQREQNILSLILCDIDSFKLFNDNYGHQEGDKCLYAVAQAVASVPKRPADLVARYGGEEIVLVLPNTTSEGAFTVAEIIRKKIENLKIPHAHSKASPYVTLSLGVSSVIPNHPLLPANLVKAADNALYDAKEQGRNRVISNLCAGDT